VIAVSVTNRHTTEPGGTAILRDQVARIRARAHAGLGVESEVEHAARPRPALRVGIAQLRAPAPDSGLDARESSGTLVVVRALIVGGSDIGDLATCRRLGRSIAEITRLVRRATTLGHQRAPSRERRVAAAAAAIG